MLRIQFLRVNALSFYPEMNPILQHSSVHLAYAFQLLQQVMQKSVLKKYTLVSLLSINEFPDQAHPSLCLKCEEEKTL